MTQPTTDEILADRIATILEKALSTLIRDETGARVFSIDEAAERLNMAPRTLAILCRRKLVTHTRIGRSPGLTAQQIDVVAARHVVEGTANPLPSDVDEMQQAIQMSRSPASRRRSRRAA
jgi:hypothetical protein